MSSTASGLAKPFLWVSSAIIPRRIGDGVSQPPWPWRAAVLAVVVSFAAFLGLPELLGRVWKLHGADLFFPVLVLSIPMLWCLQWLARQAGTSVEKVFGLAGVRVRQVLASGILLFILESLLLVAATLTLKGLGFKRETNGPSPSSLFIIVDATIWAPVCEELWFRALLYTSLRTRFGVGLSVIITATAFALVHTPSSVHTVLVLFVDGLLMSGWYERTRSLWPNIISHCLNNVMAAL